ncbi:MAG TPA: DEAD/DEAH box helicase [Gemmatimonadaceae bacterium]|nr:DEAD/DEAH box helicase [Gemmatimonadaceae bacterium]
MTDIHTTQAEQGDAPAGFDALGLSPALLEALTVLGYEEPTPIQREAIPLLLGGRDLLGLAATGTGKTAAFALPLLERIHMDGARPDESVTADERPVRALVLVPTRELAMQVAEALHKYGRRPFGTCVLPVYGGQDIRQQLRSLRRGIDVVVATPGRALDHIRRGSMDLSAVRYVVLDEADEMMDMGFAEDLDAILEALPAERQTALFSATMARRVGEIAERHLKEPARVTIRRETVAEGETPRVRQTAYLVRREHKVAALGRVLDMEGPTAAMVFCRTRTEVDTLTETLTSRGYRAEALHGGLNQEQRDRVMRKFREGAVELLVATDVAARGLDVEHVSHVVNFDVPSAPDAYVHRIGRTGRIGRSGVAITFAEPREQRLLRNIEQLTKQKIAFEQVPTIVDLRARRLDLLRSSIEEALMEGDLDAYRVVVEALSAEHDMMDIAVAAVRVAHEAEGGDEADDERDIPTLEMREGRGARGEGRAFDRGERGERPRRERSFDDRRPRAESRGPRAEGDDERAARGTRRPPSAARRPRDGDATRIWIGLGRSAGMRPSDIVGAIANEAGIDSRAIGAIDIADKFSLVEVPGDAAEDVIRALKGTTMRGKKVLVRRDRES